MASDRDILTSILEISGIEYASAAVGADSAIARGWRPPAREITTAAKLADLPVGSIVRDRQGDAWRLLHKIGGVGRWLCTSLLDGREADDVITFGPVTVLYVPTEEAGGRG
ncbi:hypothetical protein GV792_04820 [Nocardia cyriacigeorgica]|uniref:hypothetical protein n=1 Tax=Nocardia cyriacigeorgica TaxID=135487 RepID=UPI0013BDD038|nr:hypothetical protein [Nocardia cyriacigeorgica]NEW49366.1 hypothetical protein [Nocardia cyriacigeorgica]